MVNINPAVNTKAGASSPTAKPNVSGDGAGQPVDQATLSGNGAAAAAPAKAFSVAVQDKPDAAPKPVQVQAAAAKLVNWVPDLEKSKLVETPSTVEDLARMGRSVRLTENVLMIGPTGAGKTSRVKYLAALTNNELRRINLSDMTDNTELIGGYKPGPNGGFEWVDGIITESIKKGQWLLLDEINLAEPAILERINSLLDDDRYLVLTEKQNEVVRAHPNTRIFATMNPTSYSGRKELSEAMLNRFHRLYIQPPEAQELAQIAGANSKLDQKTLLEMVMFHSSIQDMADHRQIGKRDGPYPYTLRDLLKWVDRVDKFQKLNPQMPVDQIIYREARDIYMERLQNPADRKAVEDILKLKISTGSGYKEPNMTIDKSGMTLKIGDTSLPITPQVGELVPGPDADLYPIQTTVKSLYKMSKCVAVDEPVLLVGPTAAGKTSMVRYLSRLTNSNFHRFNLGNQTDVSDFIGGYIPKPGGRPGEFEWKDGILTDAMRPRTLTELPVTAEAGSGAALGKLPAETKVNYLGQQKEVDGKMYSLVGSKDGKLQGWVDDSQLNSDWVVFDEINLASPSILERINSLLDKDRAITLTEKDNEIVYAHPSFRVFATMNPSGYAGRKDLSLAMRNRFTEMWVEDVKSRDELVAIEKFFMRKVPNGDALAEKMVDFHLALQSKIADRSVGGMVREGKTYTLRNLKMFANYMKEFAGEEGAPKAFMGGIDHVYAEQFPDAQDRESIKTLARSLQPSA